MFGFLRYLSIKTKKYPNEISTNILKTVLSLIGILFSNNHEIGILAKHQLGIKTIKKT